MWTFDSADRVNGVLRRGEPVVLYFLEGCGIGLGGPQRRLGAEQILCGSGGYKNDKKNNGIAVNADHELPPSKCEQSNLSLLPVTGCS
jgi:hypothetical protein